MAKGKNFTAAEKHFEKKRIAMQTEIKTLKEIHTKDKQSLAQTTERIHELETENMRLKDWVDRLLKYTNLEIDDIKQVCENDKKKGASLQALTELIKIFEKV